MTLSVIVPIWNVSAYLETCLSSIQAQTYTDFECICVNDGSPDDSGAIAEQFAARDPRFRVIHQKNQGLSGARNTGLDHARGDVIGFIDSDDYIHPAMFELLMETLEREQVDVAGCAVKTVDPGESVTFPPLSGTPATRRFNDPLGAFLTHKAVTTNVWSRLYRKRAIEGMRFIPGIFFEDVPWTTEVMTRISAYARIDAPCYYYRNSPKSILRSPWSNAKTDSYLTIVNTLYDYIALHRPHALRAVKTHLLNTRVKMAITRIRNSPAAARPALWLHAASAIRTLHAAGRIDSRGLPLKHKLHLWYLLHFRR